MVCKNCNKAIPATYYGPKCPFCNSPLKKGYRNKYVKSDKVSQAGTQVANKSFISLKKKENKKDIELKNYNNLIDYKTAKEKEDIKRNSKYYNVYSKGNHDNTTGAKSSKAKYVRKNKTVNATPTTFRNPSNSSYKELINTPKVENDFSSGMINNEEVYQPPVLYTVEANERPIQQGTAISVNYQKQRSTGRGFFAFCFMSFIILIALFLYRSYANNGFYFGNDTKTITQQGNVNTTVIDDEMLQYNGTSKSGQVGGQSGVGVTSIVYDNQYLEQLNFNSINDVYRLIASDSNRQKGNCLASIVAIENEIINKYGITAVNFCEMDEDFAKELRNVVAYIYNNYPKARGYLTNITLANVDNATYIAAFMPIFTFGTSKTNSRYPVAIKSQIILNAKYFLNSSKINNSVSYGVKSGYFPPNANRSSTIAHEFGHYLSYVALCNHHKSGLLIYVKASDANVMFDVYDDFNDGNFSYQMLQEAYNKYKAIYRNNVTFNEFRESISSYAIAKDKSGAYIYDETIAEAFHDCYLNGDLAQPASRLIVEVLLSYL